MDTYDKFVKDALTLRDLITDRDYTRCVINYEGDFEDLAEKNDVTGVMELEGINEQLDDLQSKGLVKDVRYGQNSFRYNGENEIPMPVTFELATDVLISRDNLYDLSETSNVYTLNNADSWDWEPMSEPQLEIEGYDGFVTEDGDIEIHTQEDQIADSLDSRQEIERI